MTWIQLDGDTFVEEVTPAQVVSLSKLRAELARLEEDFLVAQKNYKDFLDFLKAQTLSIQQDLGAVIVEKHAPMMKLEADITETKRVINELTNGNII